MYINEISRGFVSAVVYMFNNQGLRMFGSEGKEPHKDIRGRVFMFDMNRPEDDPIELEIEDLPGEEDFNPHGITSWQGENGE